jgi:putative ABC transport system permease protein
MIRVAFKILLADRAKYLALVLGIMFSTLLISQQAAIFHSVMISSTQAIREASAADIWVTKPSVEILDYSDPMPELYVNRVRSVPGVAWAVPYYQAMATMRTPSGQLKPVFLIGVDDSSMVAAPIHHMVLGEVKDLARPSAVIMDLPGFVRDFPDQPPEPGLVVEIGQQRAEVVGFCKVPPNWSGQTMVYTQRSNAVAMARETINPVTAVLARAGDGQSPEAVARRISATTGLAAYSRREFADRNLRWMLVNSGVAENFGITIGMGVLIGVAIVGQTFYLFSVENLKQFAALKAIGVSNRRILAMILTQASFVAVIGYCLGIGVASLFFAIVHPGTGGMRGMFMSPAIFLGTGLFVFVVTLAACLLSVRRVLVVDPAIVFRG